MVVINQQYDKYQHLSDQASQKDIDRTSENLLAVYPGLVGGFPANCGAACVQYNMSLTNAGGVGVQIVRVYVNSTTQPSQPAQTGCASSVTVLAPCVLNPAQTTRTIMSFALIDSFVSAGEYNHIVRLWLPQSLTLPNVTVTPSNSIWIVTAKGRVFSFTWPFPPLGQGLGGTGTPLNIQTGSMRVAYNGTGSNPISGTSTDTCHQERPPLTLPAGGGTLNFVNPWITTTILNNAQSSLPNPVATVSTRCSTGQCLYISVHSANTLGSPITFSWGQLVILIARAGPNSKQLFIGGQYAGIVSVKNNIYKFTGYGTDVTVQPGEDFYLIFKITNINYSSPPAGSSGDLFTGTATVNNAYSNHAEGTGYQGFVIFLDGLYVRNNGGSGCS